MLLPNLDELDANGKKGDWCFLNGDTMIAIQWGEYLDICILNVNQTDTKWKPSWDWDGNKEAPTLSPSIRVMGGQGQPDKWHGYLRNGKLEPA